MASKASSRTLTDHDEIQQWAEERGAKPAAVRSTENDDDIGIIRLDFPGYSGNDSLEEVGWDEWFEQFDDRNLALVVQEETANGKPSNFNKLVSRDSVEESSQQNKSSGRGSASGQSGRRSTVAGSNGKTSRSSKKKAASSSESGQSKRTSASTRSRESHSSRRKKSSGRKAA
jgi:hypothetical protein